MHQARCVATLSLLVSLFAVVPAARAADAAQPQSSVSVGAGVAYLPEYAGADNSRAVPLFSYDYANKNGLFASTSHGIGYQNALGPFRVSAALGFDGGRKESGGRYRNGSDTLRGMGDVAGTALAKLGIGYDFGFLSVGVEASLALGNRKRGNNFQLAVGVPLLKTANDQVSLFGSADYGDNRYMQTYYGVTALQSSRSQFRVYSARAGFDKLGLGASWNHKLSDQWSFQAMGGVFDMVGDARNSPLTKRRSTPMIATSFQYSY